MQSTRLARYSASDISIIFGAFSITGLAPGTFFEAAPLNARYTSSAGAAGEVLVAGSGDNRHSLTLTLLQSSLANKLLSDFFNSGERLPGGIAIAPFECINLLSGEAVIAPKTWITQNAPISYGAEGIERPWVLETNKATLNHEGSPSI